MDDGKTRRSVSSGGDRRRVPSRQAPAKSARRDLVGYPRSGRANTFTTGATRSIPLRYTNRLMMTTFTVSFGNRADGSGVNLDGSIAFGMAEIVSGGSVARTTRFSRQVLLTQIAWSTLHMVNFITLLRWMLARRESTRWRGWSGYGERVQDGRRLGTRCGPGLNRWGRSCGGRRVYMG